MFKNFFNYEKKLLNYYDIKLNLLHYLKNNK